MSKIKNKELRFLIKDFLFENHINEKFQPDMAHYVSYNKDKPGPMINGDNEYEKSFDIEEDLPLAPSDIMTDPNFLKVVHNIEDENYKPANKKELRSAVLTLIDRCDDLESQKKIKKAWSSFKIVLNKVCNK
jgi:hypothetical protein